MNQMWILKLDELIVGMLDELKEQDELPSIMNGENCSLGVLYDAFQTGFKNFDWQLDKIMETIWHLLHDSPARRCVYSKASENEEFILGKSLACKF